MRLGFLVAGYTEQYYFWEIVILVRKSIVVIFIVFLSSVSSGMQSLVSTAILTFFAVLQWHTKPYYDPMLNNMEQMSLFVIIFTIYAGLYYQAGEGDVIVESDFVKWVVFFAVIIPSLVFIVNFIIKIRIEILKVAAAKSTKLFRYLTCGSVNVAEFKLKYMAGMNEEEENSFLDEQHVFPRAKNLQGFMQQDK